MNKYYLYVLFVLLLTSCSKVNPEIRLEELTSSSVAQELKVKKFYSEGVTDVSYAFVLQGNEQALLNSFKFDACESKMQKNNLSSFLERSNLFKNNEFNWNNIKISYDDNAGRVYFLLKHQPENQLVLVVWHI